MTEDAICLIRDGEDARWRISRRDAEVLREVQEVMRWWLPALSATDDLVTAVRAIEQIEDIIDLGRSPTLTTEFVVSRVDPVSGGVSAHVIVGSSGIDLACFEWRPNPNGTLDCRTMTGADGRPICMVLDRDGSYDRERFERCYFQALDSGPQEVRDQNVRGEISVQD